MISTGERRVIGSAFRWCSEVHRSIPDRRPSRALLAAVRILTCYDESSQLQRGSLRHYAPIVRLGDSASRAARVRHAREAIVRNGSLHRRTVRHCASRRVRDPATRCDRPAAAAAETRLRAWPRESRIRIAPESGRSSGSVSFFSGSYLTVLELGVFRDQLDHLAFDDLISQAHPSCPCFSIRARTRRTGSLLWQQSARSPCRNLPARRRSLRPRRSAPG